MPAPITNGELGSSVRSKINTGFTELATAQTDISTLNSGKQATLVSGTNIKTINGTSVLGSDDLVIPGVTDGDKGDITVSSSGAAWAIDNGVVTNAKLATMATASFKGRATAGTGAVEDLSVSQVKTLLAIGISDVTGLQTALDGKASTSAFTSGAAGLAPASGGGTTNFLRADGTWANPPGGAGISDGDKGDITVASSGTVWTIDNAAVTDAKISNRTALSVWGRATNSAGVGADLVAGNDGEVLRRSGTALGFGTIATAGVADAAITLAKMANLAQDQFIGRTTASTGVPQTATITAAARTVLDDTTVAAMVDTLGGASSSGTGGLARVNAPTINALVATGVTTYSGASNFLETSLGNFEAHTADGPQLTSTMTANASLTFDATPPDGRVFGPIRVPANSGGPYTLTIPSSVNAITGATITTVSVPASGQVELTFRRIGSVNYVYGVPSSGSSVTLADITDMSANARTFNAAADYSAMRTALGVAIGTNVQAFNSVLSTLAGASANGQSLVTAANYGAMRTLLTLVPGTDVQAYDADLATIAGLTATTDNFIQSKSGAWASRTVAQVAADLNGTGLVATNLAYRHIPQNSQSTAYTAVAADAGGHILHPTADNNARTFTIPANSSVAYPIGAAITFVNQINTVTIAINTDTLVLAGPGTTGSRTLAANGMATAIKIASTTWMISGTGLT